MEEAIRGSPQQFAWQPEITNAERLKPAVKFILAGMGGSHLSGGLLQTLKPEIDMIVHKDYGLPPLAKEELKTRLVIVSSYSGNTEEALDALKTALDRQLEVAAVSAGGQLLKLAQEKGLPHIRLPETGLQPRSALGFSLRAVLKLVGEEALLQESGELAQTLKADDFHGPGQALAKRLKDKIPLIYASSANQAIAYTWKIKFNEGAKIPAFANVFPELNHNELAGLEKLAEKFYFICLADPDDDPRIKKRMALTEELLGRRGLAVETVSLAGPTKIYRIFASLLLCDWAAYHLAKEYGLEPEQVPLIEEFKKLMKD